MATNRRNYVPMGDCPECGHALTWHTHESESRDGCTAVVQLPGQAVGYCPCKHTLREH